MASASSAFAHRLALRRRRLAQRVTQLVQPAIATLKRKDSISRVESSTVLRDRSRELGLQLPVRQPGAVTSTRAPHAVQELRRACRARRRPSRCRPPAGRRTASSGGRRRPRTLPARAPRSTPLPSDLDIALPWLMTWPWFISAVKGSTKSTMPMSCSTLVKKRLYSRCRIACSTPPTYCVDGHPLADLLGVERACRRSPASSSAGSTRTSRRRCPSCRCRARPGRRTSGRSSRPRRGWTPAARRPWAAAPRRSCRAAAPAAGRRAPATLAAGAGSGRPGSGSPRSAGASSSQSRSR